MRETFENILIVAGSGRNCGKTTFLCSLLRKMNHPEMAAIKITPHFHEPTPQLILLNETSFFKIFREENTSSNKDSSHYLQAGAKTSLYIQTKDDSVQDAFLAALKFLDEKQPVVVESAALAKYIAPSLFLLIQKENEPLKDSAKDMISLADQLVQSDGKQFSISPEHITFQQTWKIIQS